MSMLRQYIDHSRPVLRPEEPVVRALEILEEAGRTAAPVVGGQHLLAVVRTGDLRQVLMDAGDGETVPVGEVDSPAVAFLREDAHLLDAVREMVGSGMDFMPVLSLDDRYVGTAELRSLLKDVCRLYHLEPDEATVELEVPAIGIRVSEIVHALEKNDATVLSFGVQTPEPDAEGMLITFRVSTTDLYRLVKNLENYGYLVVYHTPFSAEGGDELRDKALEFMRYIDM
ncbi:CBS domain-containing protein [Prosthecochloris sp. N3]|uniref:CBS domain-containing protein n=1 Tax=Prosthecochloris ethylica TaxID=2743976 RepID=A0ABR9XPG8_9CHLB|nr:MULTISPECIES: CBS domain-containing protein [Prosthecochloris]MBF0586219.1 CBS domain-containing protein [Prosthecochloris ethylica]MBF0635925.1 CBS domain-containing protein [Prosthecochloris ethylica]NUK47400.1 CBS domain-containing protein [Prosthecochloris ethylica]RNA64951.1 CBS domain-containing protein [Prosthecochloris sp. ZM_2]